jgi:hypothetical protein
MKATDAKRVLQEVGSVLAEVSAEGHRGELLMLREDLAELEAAEPEPSLRLLPKFDALIIGHRDKTRLMGEEARGRVFLPAAEVAAAVLVDGRVEGVWSIKRSGDDWSLDVQLFKGLDGEHEEMLQGEIDAIRAFTGFNIEASIGSVLA